MARDEEMTSFLFRLPKNLKRRLESKAQSENKSVNATLQDPPQQVEAGSFEKRNFLGQKIAGQKIDQANGLVEVNGIYYRYLIEGNRPVDKQADYIVIEAVGNIITLRPLVGE